MSGFELIGAISGIISLLDTSIKIYDSAKNDLKLSTTFEIVRRHLPVLLHTLETCKSHLKSMPDSISEDVGTALEATLDACDSNSNNLRAIFEKIIPGQSDTWEKRYLKVLRRLGKGNKVEELMKSITEDVQVIVNHNMVQSANSEQKVKLENIIKEMKEVDSSVPDEENKTMAFSSGGGAQTNNLNTGSGQLINNHAPVTTQYFGSVTVRHKEDFSFLGPAGVHLGQAPKIAPELFIGRRSELHEIARILQPLHPPRTQQRLFLGGIGGIGKTQLAIAYAESHRGWYSSVFWLNAASEAALKDSFRSIASLIFSVQDPEVLESSAIVERVRRWLSESRNTGWLLIFDNYDDPNQFKIDDYFPTASHGAVLVTTRQPHLVAEKILDIFSLQNIEEGLAILQTRSKRENIQSDLYANRLAERLDGLPLALATAGTYIKRTGLTFERYLHEYEICWNIRSSRHNNLQQLQEYHERTLYTTWDLSYAHLTTEDLYAAKLLRLFAYFDNQGLCYEILHAGLTDNCPEWLLEVLRSDIAFREVMAVLTQHYFIETDSIPALWSMHNCVHDWALATLNQNIDMKHYWYAFDCVDACIAGVHDDSLDHISYSRLTGHAARLAEQRFLENDVISDYNPDRLVMISRISLLLRKQLQLDRAKMMYMQALAGYEKGLGPDHPLTLVIVNELGNLYHDLGKLDKAEKMCIRALAGYEIALGPDHESTLNAAGNLGVIYHDKGKLDKAEQIYMRALAGYNKVLGPGHISTLLTLNSLGILYCDQGKHAKVEQIFTLALAGCEEALGPVHASTLQTLSNLGNLYSHQGKLDKAEQIYMRVLAGHEKTVGPDHTSTLKIVHNLGAIYRRQDKLDTAKAMFIRVLAGFEKALGPDHPSTLLILSNLGNINCDLGKLDEAEEMYKRALAGKEKALGPDHISTLNTVKHLGDLYCDQGKLDEAEHMFTRALAGRVKALGLDHTSTLAVEKSLWYLSFLKGKAVGMRCWALIRTSKVFYAAGILAVVFILS